MNRASIKTFTLTSSFSGIVIVSLIALLISNEFLTYWLTDNYDQNLISKINLMQTLTEIDEEGLEFEFADEYMTEYSRQVSPEYFQIWTNKDQVFERSSSLKSKDLVFETTQQDGYSIQNIRLPDGRNGRLVSVSFYPKLDDDLKDGDGDEHQHELKTQSGTAEVESEFTGNRPEDVEHEIPLVTIAIAKERETLDSTITYANLILFAAFLTLLIFLSIIVWWSVNRGLKPLEELHHKISILNFKKKEDRLKLSSTPLELTLLVNQFNTMLDSIREGFEREHQFSSDVAHELKTPIAEIRTISEVALIGQDLEQELAGSIKSILDVSIKMGDLVNKLLAHARSEDSNNPLKLQIVNVKQVILNSMKNNQSAIDSLNLQLETTYVGTHLFNTSIIEFTQIVGNLISNAVQYSPPDQSIQISWESNVSGFRLQVSNIAEDIEDDDLAHIFKRLWKKDFARTNVKNFGIGLALVKAYCEALNYKINTSISNKLFCISISGLNIIYEEE